MGEGEAPDLQDRLLAGIAAPFAFNLAVFIVYAIVDDAADFALDFMEVKAVPLLVVLVVVPAVAGFAFGTPGLLWFLGHSFHTHTAAQRDWRVTAAIWAGLICTVLLLGLFI